MLKPVEQWKPAREDYARIVYERTSETVYVEATCDEREYRLVVATLLSMMDVSDQTIVLRLADMMRASEPKSLTYRMVRAGNICQDSGVPLNPDPLSHTIICDPMIAAYERERAVHQESRS